MKISEYKLNSDSIYLVQWQPSGYCYIVERIKLLLSGRIDENLLQEDIQELRNTKDAVIYADKKAMELMKKRCEEVANVCFNTDGRFLHFMDILVRDFSEFPRNDWSVNPYQKEQLVAS